MTGNRSRIFFAAVLCCIGMSLHAYAAGPQALYKAYTGETVVQAGEGGLSMPGYEPDGGSSQLGSISMPQVFQNSFAGFSISIPEGYEVQLGRDVLYDLDTAFMTYGYAPDLLLSSAWFYTSEVPDPEAEEDDTSVLMSFFLPKLKADGSPMDLNAYMLGVIGRLIPKKELLSYTETGMKGLGGKEYLLYRLDYTSALQQYYHKVYAGESEHPAFEESFPFEIELYCRELPDQYYLILYVKNGERFESQPELTSYIF